MAEKEMKMNSRSPKGKNIQKTGHEKSPIIIKGKDLRDVLMKIRDFVKPILGMRQARKVGFNLLFLRMILSNTGQDSRKLHFHGSIKLPKITFDKLKESPTKKIKEQNEYLEKNNCFFNELLKNISYEDELFSTEHFKKMIIKLEQVDITGIHVNKIWENYENIFLNERSIERSMTNEFVTKIINELMDEDVKNIYDPAAGIGTLLLNILKPYKDEPLNRPKIFASEYNDEIFELLRMNFFIHGVFDANLKCSDSILKPAFTENSKLQQFDLIMTHLPFEATKIKLNKKVNTIYKDFKYGFPNNLSRDYLLLLHSIASMNEKGKAYIIMENRNINDVKVKNIFKMLFEDDLIEGIINLNRFVSRNVLSQLLILNKNKAKKDKEKIIIFDLSGYLKEGMPERTIFGFRNFEKVNEAIRSYKNQEEKKGILKRIGLDELRKNDYSVNAGDYLFELKDFQSPDEILEKMNEIDNKLEKIKIEKDKLLKELINESEK